MVKHLPTMRETLVWPLDWEDPLENEMAIYSSTLAWEIPWMENPGRLQSMGSQRVGHDWATSLHFKSFQSSPILWDPMDCSLPSSSVHGILQERILDRVVMPSSTDLPDPGTESTSLRLHWRVLYHQRHLWRPESQFSYTCWENEFSKLLGGSDDKESAWRAEDLSLIPGSRRSPGEGKGYPLHYSGLENSMDRGAWSMESPRVRHDWATKHIELL